jgi:hypothetical protein
MWAGVMAGRIFINYRRGDEPGFAGRLFDRLEQSFRSDQIFIDVDNIPAGHDFTDVLESEVAKCDVVLVVIGRAWLNAADEDGRRRLDNPEDFVRIEIESGLRQDKRVIPVLVNDATMPRSEDLPNSMKPLAKRNAVRLTHERFRTDADGLVKTLKAAFAQMATDEVDEHWRGAPKLRAVGVADGVRDTVETTTLDNDPEWVRSLRAIDPAVALGILGAICGAAAFSGPLDWTMTVASNRNVMWAPPALVLLVVGIGFLIWGGPLRSLAPIAALAAGAAWFLSDFAITVSPLISQTEWDTSGGIPAWSYFIWGASNGLAVVGVLSLLAPGMRNPVVWLVAAVATGVASMPFGVQSPFVPLLPGALTMAMAMVAVGLGLRSSGRNHKA